MAGMGTIDGVELPSDVQDMINLHKIWAGELNALRSEMCKLTLASLKLSEEINLRLAAMAPQDDLPA